VRQAHQVLERDGLVVKAVDEGIVQFMEFGKWLTHAVLPEFAESEWHLGLA